MRYKKYGKWKRRLFKRLWVIVKGKCPSCGCQMKKAHGYKNSATLDHIRPQSHGGPTVKSNLQIMCAGCNVRKGSKEQVPLSYGP